MTTISPLVILGLIALVIYVVIRLMTNLSAWITGARYRAYRQLAARFRGRYETRGLSDPPTVGFTHNGATVRVGLAPTIQGQPGQVARTRVVARFGEGIPFRMELQPTARPAPPQSPRATRLVTTGDHEFDSGYVVRANDVEMSRDFLSPAIRSRVAGLHQLVHRGGMLISINPERMLVQVDRNLGANAEYLAWVVEQALELHDRLIDAVTRRMREGVSIVDDAESWQEDPGAPTCKVCGEPIDESEIIVCASCNTPHHRDCWEYIGACSIYGCNGKVGVRG
jgi:Prokaryotic RING finger family 1